MKKLTLFALLITSINAFAQRGGGGPDAAYIKENYTKMEAMVPMRDGKKLMTEIYIPKDQSKKFPFMMDRTPYGVSPYGPDAFKTSMGPSSQFVHDGYIFVYQDVRGRYMSEGMFREMTPELEDHKTTKDVDEGTDTYDTIDWLLKNVPNNNGKVGVWGISYPGFFTTACLLSRHPALAAASPQAPMSDLWRDDGWHNGAFFVLANFDFYPGFTNRQDDKPTKGGGRGPRGPQITNAYDFFLKMGPVKNTNDIYYKDTIKLWNDMLNHPDFDEWWKSRNVLTHLHDIKTPTLVTGGWYDAEDLYGAINTYKTLAKENPKTPVYFVMGPWVHGGWANGAGDRLGDIYFGGPQGPHYRDDIEFKFFSHYLKGTPMNIEPINVFQTGVNKWDTFKVWPPKEAKDEQLYLLPGGKLSFTAPAAGKESYDEYVSDPANPVPFNGGVNSGMTRTYMDGDQRFLADRKDVLTYQTDVLDKDVTIAGNLWPKLNVSTTGTDADWVVKIIDVYPDTAANTIATGTGVKMAGYQQMVRSEPLRGKYRNAFDKPEPFVPGKVTPVSWELQDILHTFKKGHRIMIQVQSSMFPLIDMNPQKFTDIMKAKESDFQKATERVYTSKEHPSFIKVRVM